MTKCEQNWDNSFDSQKLNKCKPWMGYLLVMQATDGLSWMPWVLFVSNCFSRGMDLGIYYLNYISPFGPNVKVEMAESPLF